MNVPVDVWLRGSDFATTEQIEGVTRSPREWVDDDVRHVLEGMLRAMDRRQRPGEEGREIALRGLSWIVNTYEDSGHRYRDHIGRSSRRAVRHRQGAAGGDDCPCAVASVDSGFIGDPLRFAARRLFGSVLLKRSLTQRQRGSRSDACLAEVGELDFGDG